MKVLVLDRGKKNYLRVRYKEILEKRGHEVVSLQLLTTLEDYINNPDSYLHRFDVAVVHPHWSCAQALDRELNEREDFRVLMFKLNGNSEYNGRLIYKNFVEEEDLIEFVEGRLCR